jgi:hypothetical protein
VGAARAASPEYDAQLTLIGTGIKASSGAPVVPPKNRRQPSPPIASHGQ